jgi:hypothetical protein
MKKVEEGRDRKATKLKKKRTPSLLTVWQRLPRCNDATDVTATRDDGPEAGHVPEHVQMSALPSVAWHAARSEKHSYISKILQKTSTTRGEGAR